MNANKILRFLATFMILMLILGAVAACGDTPATPECTEHKDLDKNGRCDSCEAEVEIPDEPAVKVKIIEKNKETEYVIVSFVA